MKKTQAVLSNVTAKSNVLCLFTVGEQRKPLIHKAFRYPCSLFSIFTNINKKININNIYREKSQKWTNWEQKCRKTLIYKGFECSLGGEHKREQDDVFLKHPVLDSLGGKMFIETSEGLRNVSYLGLVAYLKQSKNS